MAIIAGVNIPDNQRLEIALTAIYSIGRTTSKKIVGDVGMGDTTRARDLTDEDLARVRSAVERTGLLIEGDLRRETQLNIRRLTCTPPQGPAGPRTANKDQRPNKAGTPTDSRRSEASCSSLGLITTRKRQ